MRYSDTLKTRVLAVLMAALLGPGLAACGSSSSGSGSGSDDLASVSLRLTDAPAALAEKVVVTFTEVHLQRDDGTWSRFELESPKPIDLVKLQGTNTEELLPEVEVPAGPYTEIRLITSPDPMDNQIEATIGALSPLFIPSGSSSGLKIKGDFDLIGNTDNTMIADFDLLQSVKLLPNGTYLLKPVVRLVKLGEVGSISDTVSLADLTDQAGNSCSDANPATDNAVYVFAGHDADVDDIDLDPGKGPNEATPVTTARIEYNATTMEGEYTAAYLPAGDYTIAITCNASAEDLDDDGDEVALDFFGIQNVTVLVSNTLFL